MNCAAPRAEYRGVALLLRPTLGPTARTAVVGAFEEFVHEGLLGEWIRAIRSSDDVTLILLSHRSPEEVVAAGRSLEQKFQLMAPGAADVALLPCSPSVDGLIAAEADFLCSRREASGPLAALPRVGSAAAFLAKRAARRGRAVFVLGMHRSGTSAITRVINMLGVPLSVPDDLLPPQDDNPTGFWESSMAVNLNAGVLARCGGAAFNPPALQAGWELADELAAVRWQARESFARAFPTREWVLKDPRCCFTLPFWRAVLDVDPVVVVPYRNPIEVAGSLGARNGIPLRQALSLWESYVRSSFAVAEGLPVSIHSFEDLVDRPAKHVGRLRDFLRGHGFTLRDAGAGAMEEIEAFLSRRLRHHRHGKGDVRRLATSEQAALYDRLARAA